MNTMSTDLKNASKTRTYELKERARSQEQTRQRIAAAAAGLHEEVGPARTTVTEVAKRAGVQRLTVYKHFPTEGDLFAGCSAHFMSQHPFPDLSDVLAIEEPERRLRETLALIYARFRETERMTANIQRDRLLIPALDAFMSGTADPQIEWIAGKLIGGFRAKGARAGRVAALVAVSIDFWTWRRLKQAGLKDEAAAELMAEAVSGA
jgi:AcrR family transcriptional regulator